MTGTEVNTSSAWAERALAVLLLPFAFLVMVGGGAGLIWLWQDYRPQFWIGVCAVAVLAFLASTGTNVASRQQRRIRWLSSRHDAGLMLEEPSDTSAERSDVHDLLVELLSRVDAMQGDLDLITGEFTVEQDRARPGRHSGQSSGRRSAVAQLSEADVLTGDQHQHILVDIRDEVDELGLDDDEDDLYDYSDGESDDESIDVSDASTGHLDADGDLEVHDDGIDDVAGQSIQLTEDELPDDPVPEADEAHNEHARLDSGSATPADDLSSHEPSQAESTPAMDDGESAEQSVQADNEARSAADDADATLLTEALHSQALPNEPDQEPGDEAALTSDEGSSATSDVGNSETFLGPRISPEQPQRKLRRLVRDRRSRQHWEAIPAPRDPIQVIDLGDDSPFPPGNHDAGDDRDYFGDDVNPVREHPEHRPDRSRPDRSRSDGDMRDDYRSSFLGEDDDKPREAG